MTNKNIGIAPTKSDFSDRKSHQRLLEFLPDPVFAFSLDNRIEYVNPAFEQVFGWTLKEVKGKNVRFIPNHLIGQARQGLRDLFKYRSVHNFETQRYTKDGQLLDILLNASLIYDDSNTPIGHVLILRDLTSEKRIEKSRDSMFRISQALHSHRELNDLIAFINREIKRLLEVEGAFVLLADEEMDQLYFYAARFRNAESDKKFKKIRFPADEGVSGRAFSTGRPVLVPDVSQCDFYYQRVTEETDLVSRNMLSIPIQVKDRKIGVVSVVNKISGDFDDTDIQLLSTVSGTIALPIENARIHDALKQSHAELKVLNHAKDKVINHLAHEMKTPAAVLGASFKLLMKRLQSRNMLNPTIEKGLKRARRNLDRILDIHYEAEDLLKTPDYKPHHLLTRMADACKDEMKTLLDKEFPDLFPDLMNRLYHVVDHFFGPRKAVCQSISLPLYLQKKIQDLDHVLQSRNCVLNHEIKQTPKVLIPKEVLDIVVNGIIRNSIEYTPDHGKITLKLAIREHEPELVIQDTGVGFTKDKMHLIFENYFTPPESCDYMTKTPYAFNAGGNGFDLLRMQIFSEKYQFKLWIDSQRCRFIPKDSDVCPGDILQCSFCKTRDDCFESGGTSVHVRFSTLS